MAITSSSAYLWEAVNGDPDINYYVIQIDNLLMFHDASVNNPTTSPLDIAFNLGDQIPTGVTILPENFRCDFTNVKGALMVCNPAINPLMVRHTPDGDEDLTFSEINIYIRDFLGIGDGLRVDQRPKSIGKEELPAEPTDEQVQAQLQGQRHEYNLYNQGWYQRRKTQEANYGFDTVEDFSDKIGAYPSNADIQYMGMGVYENLSDPDDFRIGQAIFKPETIRDEVTTGATPAPRGHYIFDAFYTDREQARLNPASFIFDEDTEPGSPEEGSTGNTGGSGDQGDYFEDEKPKPGFEWN